MWHAFRIQYVIELDNLIERNGFRTRYDSTWKSLRFVTSNKYNMYVFGSMFSRILLLLTNWSCYLKVFCEMHKIWILIWNM